MWLSIKRLIHPERYDEDYVMRLEEERGLISIYGQGEISYTADNSQLPMDSAVLSAYTAKARSHTLPITVN
ncbi:unnamed protein product [Penicillium roqueforti FM164]|uniref:Genomic scaffold, ProqFM164S02 n=1 Tax=Penicillium roqueforti (strain FM164) TaxID=1365484 RepID=W6Q7S3_PENRF|nr:unnamed protein product [Penicillium roqueforti FM164]